MATYKNTKFALKKGKKMTGLPKQRKSGKGITQNAIKWVICFAALYLTLGTKQVLAEWPHIVPSKDGTPISYELHGTGGRHWYSYMDGAAIPDTGVPSCHTSPNTIASLRLTLRATAIQGGHVYGTP